MQQNWRGSGIRLFIRRSLTRWEKKNEPAHSDAEIERRMDNTEDTNLPQTAACVVVLTPPASPYTETEQLLHAAYEPLRNEPRTPSQYIPQLAPSGVGSVAGGEPSRAIANHGYASSEVPVVRAFTQHDYEASQALLKLSRALLEEDSRSAEIVPLSPSRMTTDAPIHVATPMKLSFVNQVAEISLPPRKVIDKRRARNAGQSQGSRGKKPNTVAPASTIPVRNAARLQRSGSEDGSMVERSATARFTPRSKTNYRPAGEGEDRPFKCTEDGCKSSFISNGHLQQHIRTVHKGERAYICKKVIKPKEGRVAKPQPCGRGFSSAFALKLVCLTLYFSVAMTRMFRYSRR